MAKTNKSGIPNVILPNLVRRIIKEADHSPNKGNYTTFNHYKRMFDTIGLSSDEYQEAVKLLADVLRV